MSRPPRYQGTAGRVGYFRFMAPACLLFLTSCLPLAGTPMGSIRFPGQDQGTPSTLLVFLPGRGGVPAGFRREGFVDEVRRQGVKADLVAADATYGYYVTNTLIPRLKEDIIDPARRQGYRHIWLVGISMGGTGALWYDREHPGEVTGLVLLSPFLGEEEIIREISRAGGLASWTPPPVIPENDDQRRIWKSLKAYLRDENRGGRVFLGYGTNDPFAPAERLLAEALPRNQVATVNGGHDWPTWRILWHALLPFLGVERTAR